MSHFNHTEVRFPPYVGISRRVSDVMPWLQMDSQVSLRLFPKRRATATFEACSKAKEVALDSWPAAAVIRDGSNGPEHLSRRGSSPLYGQGQRPQPHSRSLKRGELESFQSARRLKRDDSSHHVR
jgi:hypothetical protein